MTLATLLSLKTMELPQIGVAIHFQAAQLFSMRTVLLASSQSCRSVDADFWCKRTLRLASPTCYFLLSDRNSAVPVPVPDRDQSNAQVQTQAQVQPKFANFVPVSVQAPFKFGVNKP